MLYSSPRSGYLIWVYSQGVLSAELGIYEASVAGVASFILIGIIAIYNPPAEPAPTT